ncbi:MAG: hypothetical protein ABGX05_05275 [Pirellulaceae bacterium]
MHDESSHQQAENPGENAAQQIDEVVSSQIDSGNYYARKMPDDVARWDDLALAVAAFVFGVGCLLAIVAGVWTFAVLARQQILYALLSVVGAVLTTFLCYAFVVVFLRVRKL